MHKPAPAIPAELMREAISYAAQHHQPLLRRLAKPRKSDVIVLAVEWGGNGMYYFSTEDVESGMVRRRFHLEWLREQMEAGTADERMGAFEKAFDSAYVEQLLDSAASGKQKLDERTYAIAYGGPVGGSRKELTKWFEERVYFEDVAGQFDFDTLAATLRCGSPSYERFCEAVRACESVMPWRHPDTGEEVGDIGLIASMTADSTLVSSSYETLTFFQWTCDLMDAGIQLEISSQQDRHR